MDLFSKRWKFWTCFFQALEIKTRVFSRPWKRHLIKQGGVEMQKAFLAKARRSQSLRRNKSGGPDVVYMGVGGRCFVSAANRDTAATERRPRVLGMT